VAPTCRTLLSLRVGRWDSLLCLWFGLNVLYLMRWVICPPVTVIDADVTAVFEVNAGIFNTVRLEHNICVVYYHCLDLNHYVSVVGCCTQLLCKLLCCLLCLTPFNASVIIRGTMHLVFGFGFYHCK